MKKVCLIVMDGWGKSRKKKGNAVSLANTPNIDRLAKEYPSASLDASGLAVGLPEGQMGNSEVGHLTLGAGRVIYQEFTRINKAVESGELVENPVLEDLMDGVMDSGGALHVMGLVSDGGVHSHLKHLYAVLEAAKKKGLKRVFIHVFTDGRDTSPTGGERYVKDLVKQANRIGVGRVATVSGRFYAMDRDNRWDRVEKAYRAIALGEGLASPDPVKAVEESYARGETDEFIVPTVITEGGGAETSGTAVGKVSDGDGFLFFNFRADRARELTRAFTEEGFKGFPVRDRPRLAGFATMTEYDRNFDLPVLFAPQGLENILGDVLSGNDVKQFRVSETEKYAHVTFFFNGGREDAFPGEDRRLIPSVQDVPTYDKKPEMRAAEIADAAVEKINEGGYGFMLMNFANGDMVGHTGVIDAAVRGCEAVDTAVGRVVDSALGGGWSVIVTSDHGNAEMMIDPDTGKDFTAHTVNKVPVILVDEELKNRRLRHRKGLRDVAPTVLKLMGLEKPGDMTGEAIY